MCSAATCDLNHIVTSCTHFGETEQKRHCENEGSICVVAECCCRHMMRKEMSNEFPCTENTCSKSHPECRQEANGGDDLISCLEYHARSSRTATLWVYGMIKPVFLMMIFCRAEREENWPLHIRAVSLVIPYCFTAAQRGTIIYGCYCMYHLRSSEAAQNER